MRLLLILPRVEPGEINHRLSAPMRIAMAAGFSSGRKWRSRCATPGTPKWWPIATNACVVFVRLASIPRGVSQDHISQRVKGLAILLYLLGLSYGAVSLALDALGIYMCKSRVCDAVQAAAERVPGMK